MNAYEAAEANGRPAELQDEIEALLTIQNTSTTDTATRIPVTFLRVTVGL